jgi:hypothetical protein
LRAALAAASSRESSCSCRGVSNSSGNADLLDPAAISQPVDSELLEEAELPPPNPPFSNTPRELFSLEPLEEEHAPLQSWDPQLSLDLATPPPDIVPFLGEAAYSVAGQLYWTTMAFAHTTAKAMRSPEPPLTARIVAKKVFGTVLSQLSLDDMRAMLADRLAFRSSEYVSVEHVHEDRVRRENNYKAIKMIFQLDPDLLDCFAVEAQLRERMGPRFESFRQTLCGGTSRTDASTHLMRDLIRMLTMKTNCTAEGPRWDANTVTWVANQWVEVMF